MTGMARKAGAERRRILKLTTRLLLLLERKTDSKQLIYAVNIYHYRKCKIHDLQNL